MKGLRVFRSRRLPRLFSKREAPEGRVVKRLRKCYLDPDIYSYVSSTHGTSASLSGASLRGEEARVPGGPAGPRALSAFLYKFTCKI
jgi:hypothetical protein